MGTHLCPPGYAGHGGDPGAHAIRGKTQFFRNFMKIQALLVHAPDLKRQRFGEFRHSRTHRRGFKCNFPAKRTGRRITPVTPGRTG